jgi:MFS family permease
VTNREAGEEKAGAVGAVSEAAASRVVPSTFAPLARPLFRWLWIASLGSNAGTWMQNVAAAWLMTELSTSALMIALVQAATNLPVFVLAVPAGALADIVDRRRLLLAAQGWMLLVTAALAAATYAGLMTPWLLLTMTFLLGLGSALNAPAWQATTPELVPREEVPAAVALGGVSMNVARAVGPAVGGLVVAAAGPAAAFLLNAFSFLGVISVLARWRRPREESALPAERLLGAMRAGVRYVRHSPAFRAVLVRAAAYVLGASSLLALLPVLVKQDTGLGPAHYGILLGCFGAGAVLGVLLLPALSRWLDPDRTLTASTLVLAVATLTIAWLPYYSLWCVMLVPAGMAWLAALTRLNAAAQASAPSWVRARALAVYLLVFFGGMAAGSMLWGVVADRSGASATLTASAAWLLAGLPAGRRFRLPRGEGTDLEPSRYWPEMPMVTGLERGRGPVLVTVEYRIDPARTGAFLDSVQPLGQARLRGGALWWEVFQDAADPARLVEVFLVESLLEHLRQHERVTEADRLVQERVRAFHQADEPPAVSHLVAGLDSTDRVRESRIGR